MASQILRRMNFAVAYLLVVLCCQRLNAGAAFVVLSTRRTSSTFPSSTGETRFSSLIAPKKTALRVSSVAPEEDAQPPAGGQEAQQTVQSSSAFNGTDGTVMLLASIETTIPNEQARIPLEKSTTGTVDLWKRRLITHEDPFSFHKLASIGYTLSSAILLGSAAVRFADSPEAFSVIPSEMEPVTWAFTASNIVMCLASVRMSFIHRQGDLTARNAFLGTAVSSLFSGFFMVWISPFDPAEIFNNDLFSRTCFALLVGLNGFFIADTILKTEEVVEGRRDRKAKDYAGRKLVDTMGYVFPVAWGMPLIASTGLIASVLHDRAWFMEQCQFIDQMMGTPGMQSHIFYQQLSTSLAASYASLFVTLRDKKLISKAQELGGITVFAIPALVWSIYTTVVFMSYLFVPH